jgi:DNA end-binding protein Ku
MSQRAMAKATISFGLVAVPVKVYAATDGEATIHFNQLCGKCHGKPKQQYFCDGCQSVIAWGDMVKGYEYTKGTFLVFSGDEIKALQEESTKAIEVVEFVDMGKIDPIYFDKTYYLGPEPAAQRPYALFCAAMQEVGKVGLGKFAIRGKQYLVLLRANERGIIMHQLRYAHELREQEIAPTVVLRDEELALARQLVQQFSVPAFQPSRYRDEVRERALAAIDAKAKDGVTITASDAPKTGQIVDLMAALKASLDASAPKIVNAKPCATRKKLGGHRA